MPTYTVTTANVALTPAQEGEIAAAITDAHHRNTGAPGFFAQVLFVTLPERKHYIGGKLNSTPHIYIHGLIRAGRSAAAKTELIEQIALRAREISGVGAEDIWVTSRIFRPRWSSLDACYRRREPKSNGRKV
jgi:phenylpyruvate tautomerase PptA (4-oxalocrotonate tautomerase family)